MFGFKASLNSRWTTGKYSLIIMHTKRANFCKSVIYDEEQGNEKAECKSLTYD